MTNYVYDAANITEEVDAAGLVQARYAQGLGIDEPLAMQRDGNLDFFAADGLGSATSLTDASGTIGASYTYESFGGLLSTTGTLTNPVRYTGREYDPETRMYYYRARYYDPEIGRFISEDPIGFQGGINLFVYADNNPVIITDPSGLLSVCCRRVKSTLYIACHCFLKFSDGSTWAGYRDGSTLYLAWNHPDDYPARKPSKCYPVGGQCRSDENKVRQAVNNIPELPGGRVYGLQGVSSTPTGQALRDAGIPFKFPGCAWYSGTELGTTPLHGLPWSLSGRGYAR